MKKVAKRTIIILLVCVLLCAGMALLEIFFTIRPTEEEAVGASIYSLQIGTPVPPGVPGNYPNITMTDPRIVQTYPLKRGRIVVLTVNQRGGGQPESRQVYIDYVTRRIFTGAHSMSAMGGYYSLTQRAVAPLFLVHNQWEDATVAGGVAQDPDIKRVEATWKDNSRTTVPVTDDTYLFVREDGERLAWVIGLDGEGEIVEGSLTYAENLPGLTEYDRTRSILTDQGIIILGAYTMQPDQTCIDVLYATAENAAKLATGEAAFVKQGGCGDRADQPVGTFVSTVINNNVMTLAGTIQDTTVTGIEIHWSDGLVQRVPIIDGFYFAQRQGIRVNTQAMIPLWK